MPKPPPTFEDQRRVSRGHDRGRPVCAVLLEDGALDAPQALEALARSRHEGTDLTRHLIAEGHVSPARLRDALARCHGAPALMRSLTPPAPELAPLLPPHLCLRHAGLPWLRRGETLVLAVAHPESFARLRAHLISHHGPVEMALVTEQDIFDEIAARYGAAFAEAAEHALPTELSCRDLNRLPAKRCALLGASALLCLSLLLIAPTAFFLAGLMIASVTLLLGQIAKISAFVVGLPPLPPAPPPERHRLPPVSLLVPLHREEAIAETLVQRLGRLDYPRALLDVLLVLEAEDSTTRRALKDAALPPWMRVIEVPGGTITTKPRALNYALNFARGALIGIYDAEDSPAQGQLRMMAAHFGRAPPELGCVQGILDFYNPHANWISRCFTIEYAAWFRILLPGFLRLGFAIPLGGTTVFFRRTALERVGGWDAHNVTEDADLGFRLARFGYRTDLLPLVTREEANCRLWPWIRQRSRWLKGYMITWFVHMRQPRRALRQLGAWRLLGLQLLLLTGTVQFLLAPLFWSFWPILLGWPHPFAGPESIALLKAVTGLLLLGEGVTLLLGLAGVARSPHPGLLLWVPTLFLYFPLGTIAIYKALWEIFARPFYWDKTAHGRSSPDHPDADIPEERR